MTTFVIREKENGVLAPLGYVIQRLSFLVATTWCFRNTQVHVGRPFGLSVQEFGRLTRQSPSGYCVADRDMRMFIDADIQVIDGEIDAVAEDGTRLVTIACEDATQWEISTALPELALEMERKGFAKQVG